MRKGQQGRVVEVVNPEVEHAMLRLGLTPGEDFELSDMAPWGGPIALQVQGSKVALRRADAAHVIVTPLG